MAEKTLEIILKARDLAGKPIEALKDRIQRTRDAINQTGRTGGGLGSAVKSIGDLSKLARAVAVVEQGANAATGIFQAGAAVFKTWRGDAEGAAEAVKATGEAFRQIPVAGKAFGVGNFIGQWLFGDQADADKAVKEIEKIEAALKRSAAAAKERKKEIAFAEGFGKELETRGRTRGLEGPDLAAEQQRIRYEQERAKLTESMEKMRREQVGLNAAALEAEMRGHYQALEALAQDHAATMQAIEGKRFADAKASEEKRNTEAEQNRQTTARIIADAQREAYMAEQATREQAMRFAGDTAGAEALAIKQAWEREANGINAAKAAALSALPETATKEEADQVVKSYETAYTAAWDRFQFSLGQHEQRQQQERTQARISFAQRAAAAEFEARQAELAASGQGGQAMRERMQKDLDERIDAIRKAADEARKIGVDAAQVAADEERAIVAETTKYRIEMSKAAADAQRKSLQGFGVTEFGSSLPRGSSVGFRPEQSFPKIEDATRDTRDETRKHTPTLERSRDYLSEICSDTDKLADVAKGTASIVDVSRESVRVLKDVLAAVQKLNQGAPLKAANLTGGF